MRPTRTCGGKTRARQAAAIVALSTSFAQRIGEAAGLQVSSKGVGFVKVRSVRCVEPATDDKTAEAIA